MAVAAERQRVGAVEELVAGLHVDGGVALIDRRGVVRGLGVQVVLVDRDVDAVEVVHEVAEAAEVDDGHVVDVEAREVLDGLEGELRRARALELRAVREGGVDAVVPEPGDRHPQVAREREQRHDVRFGSIRTSMKVSDRDGEEPSV